MPVQRPDRLSAAFHKWRPAACALAAAAICASIAAGLAGCSRGRAGKTGVTNIRWVVDPNPVRQDQIAGFHELQDQVRVTLDPDAGNQKVLTQLAGKIYPDLFAIYDPASMHVFAKKGVLLDLAPIMRRHDIDLGDFWPQLRPYMVHGGKVYGLPDNCGAYVLFYNKRLFREAGVQPPDGTWDWQDLLRAANKLTKKDRLGRVTQFGIGYVEPWIIFWQYGGRMYSDDGKTCTIDSPECKAAARFWASLRLSEHVTPTPSEEQGLATLGNWGGASNLFKAERVAMHIVGRWMTVEYRKNKELDWDVAPVPQTGKVRATLLASKVYAMPAEGANTEAAAKFLKYLVSKKNQMIVSATGDGIPSVRSFADSPEFLHNPDYPNEVHNRVFLDEMAHARPPELSPYVSDLEATTIFNEEMDMMWQRLQSPDEACDRIARRITALIRRNLANPNLME